MYFSYVSVSPSWKRKINKIPVFLSDPSLFMHACSAFLPIILATAKWHPLGGYNPRFRTLFLAGMFILQFPLLPERKDSVWPSETGQESHGVKLQQTISLDMRKNLVSVRRNEEGCSDPCRNAGCCFGRERSHCPEQCMDRQGEKPILIPASEPVNSSEF